MTWCRFAGEFDVNDKQRSFLIGSCRLSVAVREGQVSAKICLSPKAVIGHLWALFAYGIRSIQFIVGRLKIVFKGLFPGNSSCWNWTLDNDRMSLDG
jgi:hypothetical protein